MISACMPRNSLLRKSYLSPLGSVPLLFTSLKSGYFSLMAFVNTFSLSIYWGPQYIERLKVFTKAIKEKYPDFRLVNSSGTDPNGDRYDFLNKELRGMHADIIDEHYYRRPE